MLEGVRVIQVSFDIVIPENLDGYEYAKSLASEINANTEVLGYDFKADLTAYYRDSWL